MSHTYGMAGGPSQHLSLPKGRPVHYLQGPFSAVLAPTPRQRLSTGILDQLVLGLFTRCPDLDGNAYEELSGAEYARQPLHVTTFNSDFHANRNGLLFDLPPADDPITHVGLFGATGDLLFYGRLESSSSSTAPTRRFEFRPFALKLKRR